MPNWIGDLVMATPVLTDLRKHFPEAEITAMCQAPLGELLKQDRDIDELFQFKKGNIFVRHEENRNIVQKLRTGKYDLGILTTNSFSSAYLFWQGNVARRIGFKKDGRTLLLTDPLPFPENKERQHLVITYKQLLAPLGIPVSNSKTRLYLTEKEIEQAKELLSKLHVKKGAKVVGVNPGAAYGSAKCWPKERFREVIERLLSQTDAYIVCFGSGDTIRLVDEICASLPSRVINLAGKTTIREMMSLIHECSIVLTNDSGPMHVASAFNIPTVALFGSTNADVTGPYNGGLVIRKEVSCAPCYLRKCPIDFRCMKQITADEVFNEVLKRL